MKILRVHITGWVSSFRNPLFISGFQPTLPLPPLSALYGILTAAKGEWVTPHDAAIGFVFHSQGKAVDLETIYQFSGKLDAKSNINRREFLVQPELYLYTPEIWLREAFKRPRYTLLMGRSSDLATVKAIDEIELESRSETTYQNTIIPFPDPQLHGQVQALPTHFTAEIPRRQCGTRAFCLITEPIKYRGNVLHDPDKNWGVYLHERLPGDFTVPVERSSRPANKDYEVRDVTGKQMPLFDF
ncbi:type I-B CRISPR-associated protein Cas5 [Candidatus Poribacteria bacterium]|nr:type I-B CRISPR-associated protein Cas5 [Candidatus Poribacteria bacterium]